MKKSNHKTGLTLVEMLIVTTIIIVLVGMVAGIAERVETQRDEHLLREAFVNINTALQHFADYGYNYSLETIPEGAERRFYRALKFPVDCNDYPPNTLGIFLPTMREVLGTGTGDITVYKMDQDGNFTILASGSDNPALQEFAGSEALYYFLNQVPECRVILNKINEQMITNDSEDGQSLYIKIDGIEQPLFRFIDPWGNSIRYDYYNEEAVSLGNWTFAEKSIRNFPTLTSAGPDGKPWTGDDIKSRER